MRRFAFSSAALLAAFLAPLACSRRQPADALAPFEVVDVALRPERLATALRQASGAHWHATASFRVSGAAGKSEKDASEKETVTTATDLWVDKAGSFRLVEENDQDGGREVVRVGPEMVVALRYERATRRPAQDPEPQRLLEEALGAPWAAWDVMRRFASVSRKGDVLQLAKGRETRPTVAAETELRKWRQTVEVQTMTGDVRLEPISGVVRSLSLSVRFTAVRGGSPIQGEITVAASVDGLGSTPDVVMPASETLQTRQRTILDERALLSGLERGLPASAPVIPRGKAKR